MTSEMSTSESPSIAHERLKSIVERVERLEEEKKGLAGDIRQIYAEAKGVGFDTKIVREIVKIRRLDAADRREQEELLDMYWRALDIA